MSNTEQQLPPCPVCGAEATEVLIGQVLYACDSESTHGDDPMRTLEQSGECRGYQRAIRNVVNWLREDAPAYGNIDWSDVYIGQLAAAIESGLHRG